MEYQIDTALGKHVIVEPLDKSNILHTEETATVFKIVSIGNEIDLKYTMGVIKTIKEYDLIIVAPNTVESTMMGNKKVYFVMDSDIIAKVKHEQQPNLPDST